MKTDQKGFMHLGFFISVLVICLTIGGTFFYVKHTASSGGTSPACKSKDGLRLCLTASKSRLSSSETTELKTTITNTTDRDVTETFNCTFTDPSILLNNEDLSLGVVCGQAITPKTIKAQTSESFTYQLSGSKMKTGFNTLKASWSSYQSGAVNVQKTKITAGELADQFTTCQRLKDNIDFSDIPDYCASISIILKNSNAGQYRCADWKALLKQVDLSLPCTTVMDIGVGYVYVPRDDAARHLQKVKSLPEVSSASIDRE